MLIRTLILLLAGNLAFAAAKESPVVQRLGEAADVFEEIMGISDKAIPQDLLERAYCIAIVPAMKKGAFIVGAKYGKGFINCRLPGRGWSAPGAVRIEGGSVGFQIGGTEVDVVMLVMNKRGAEKLLSSQFTLGGAGEVAAGPVGRSATAQTDVWMRAEILSWSRSRGVFAGLSLQGATLRQDIDDNKEMYGKAYENRQIVDSGLQPPPGAEELMKLLNKYSARQVK